VEGEALAYERNRARLVDDETGDGGGLLVRQIQSMARLRSRIVTAPSTLTEPSG